MEDGDVQKQIIQVVFLIDTHQFYENRENEKLLNKAFRTISTCTLRLLTYFVNRKDCDRSKFAWGCQFFRIPLKTHFYTKRSIFREFSLNSFNDFEKQLEEEINIATGKASCKSKQKQKATGIEVSPAFSLKYALHDASLEYRWDELIISSPLKAPKWRQKRSESKNDEHYQQQTKFVFTLLPCPLSLSELETFCEHKSTFSTSYLKKCLINTGKQESNLFDILKASLIWLDTRNLWELKQSLTHDYNASEQELEDSASSVPRNDEVHPPNTDGLDLLIDTMALLSGRVVPLQCLIDLDGYKVPTISHLLETVVNVSTSKETSENTDGPCKKQKDESCISQNASHTTLLYSSALDYYTQNKRTKCGNASSEHFLISDNPEDPGIREMNVALYGSHAKTAIPTCNLNIQLMWNCQTSVPDKATLGDHDDDDDDDFDDDDDDDVNDDDDDDDDIKVDRLARSVDSPFSGLDKLSLQRVSEQDDKESSDNESLLNVLGAIFEEVEEEVEREEEEIDDSRAVILAAISADSLSPDVYLANLVYSCLGYEVSSQGDDASQDGVGCVTSQWFLRTLDQLRRSKCLLVLRIYDQLAVLEPLTAVLGLLRVIRPEEAQRVESRIAPSGVTSPKDETDLDKEENLLASLHSHLGGNSQEITSEVVEESSEECQLDLNIHKETNSLKSFNLSCLEPWYRDLPQRGVTAKFLEQLVSLPENLLLDESINLSSALSQLKELYKSEQNIPASQEKEKKEADEKVKPAQAAKETKRKSKPIMRQFQSRTLSIYEKSIQKAEQEVPPGESSKPKKNPKKESSAVFVPDKEFSSVADLQAYVEESYDAAVACSDNFLPSAQRIVSMTIHFMKEQEKDQAKKEISSSAESFLRGHIYNTNVDLIKKYQDSQLENCQALRVRESKLQSLLRFEMEMVSPMEGEVGDSEVKGQMSSDAEEKQTGLDLSADENESELPEDVQDTVDEISQLLCSIPILADHDQLSSFLEDVVFPSYSDTIPYLVKAVYEELGHPIPKQLKSPTSSKPSVKAPSSYKAVRSWGSVDTVPSVSTRTRGLSRHPSLADMGHKRVINIQPRRAKTKILTNKKEETEKEARRAKRNLFSDGAKFPRRESVAVMEGISQSRRQSPRKHSQGGVGERAPKVLKTRTVRETPGKRQVSQSVLLNVNRARKLEARILGNAFTDGRGYRRISHEARVSSVPRSFPKQLTRRLSFYSQNHLKDARRLTSRITGSKSGGIAADIAKTVERKKSPARMLLKDVCTPSTLGSLGRLRSSKVTTDVKASPELGSGKKDDEPKRDAADDSSMEMTSPSRQTRSMEKKEERLKEGASDRGRNAGKKTGSGRQKKDSKDAEGAEMTTTSAEGRQSEGKKELTPRKRTSLRTSLKKMFDGAAVEEEGAVVRTSLKKMFDGAAVEEEGAVVRTSLKKMFDGAAVEEAVEEEVVSSAYAPQTNTRKRKIEKDNTSRSTSKEIVNGDVEEQTAAPIEQEVATEETNEETSSTHKSPSKKRRKTSGVKMMEKKNPRGGSTPSPRRKVREPLASPDMFKQWPQRKLRSTPSPKGHFLRDQIAKKILRPPTISDSPKLLDNPIVESVGRSLRQKSKTCLKFPGADSNRKDEIQTTNRNDDTDGCQIPTKTEDEEGRKLLLPKKSSSKDELERHFSFHSDDDEIEFIRIDRSHSRDSLGRELSPADNNLGDEEAVETEGSPIFNDSCGSIKSPFKSPWRSLRKTPSKTKTPKGSPVFHYVSTPSSSGMKLTFTKQSVPRPRGSSDMSSSATTSDQAASSAEEASASESILSNVSSENDEVFASLCSDDAKPKAVSTPPGSSLKVTTKLSTKGLFDLLHSPFTGSPRHSKKSLSRKQTKSNKADIN